MCESKLEADVLISSEELLFRSCMLTIEKKDE